MARHLNHLAHPPPPLLSRTGAPSLASATTSSGSPATTPLSLSSIPLLPAAPLGAPTLTLPTSALLPTSSLPSTVWCSYQSQPLPPASAPTTPPFQLASSFAPIPGKLTRRIQALEFVEMRELLPDNLVLAERLETLLARLTPAKSPEQQEVGSLLTWVSSIAVVAQAHPDRVADMLAYMRLIIREARKYGGNGWLTYDMVFRGNYEKKSVPWNYIDPSLHTAYIGGRASLPSLPVAIATRWITVVRIAPLPLPCPPQNPPPFWEPDRSQSFRSGKHPLPSFQGTPGRPQKRICISWNKGKCSFPGACSYQHICASCQVIHPAKDCPLTPTDSAFKQLGK